MWHVEGYVYSAWHCVHISEYGRNPVKETQSLLCVWSSCALTHGLHQLPYIWRCSCDPAMKHEEPSWKDPGATCSRDSSICRPSESMCVIGQATVLSSAILSLGNLWQESCLKARWPQSPSENWGNKMHVLRSVIY